MRLSIVTGVCGQVEITRQWLHETVGRCTEKPNLVIVSNGSTPEELKAIGDECLLVFERWGGAVDDDLLIWNEAEPLGSTKTFNIGLKRARGDVVAMLHNDLMVREGGWDQKILAWFAARPETGIVGFHGSRALGDEQIWTAPYRKNLLARGWSVSNMEDAESHGERSPEPYRVVTLDGMALIARRDDLLAWGGLDERYVHHMYDHDLCLTAMRLGRVNYMLPVVVRHVSGQTANFGRYNEQMKKEGFAAGDVDVHTDAHIKFYEKWKGSGLLPARLP